MNALAYIIVIAASIITLMLSLILITITLLFGKFRNSDRVNYLYFFSFSLLITGIVLALLFTLLPLFHPIRAIPFGQLQPIATSYIEVILPTASVTTTLIVAFLVRPYFRKTQITNDRLQLTISQLQLKDINNKDNIICSKCRYSGYVTQCALRVASEHFAVPTVIKNAIGWVALINKKNMVQLHGTYSPWAYGFNYVVDVVGEESLILFFIIHGSIVCDYLSCNTESVREALKPDGVIVAFPVAPSTKLRPWDSQRDLAVAFKVSNKERENLWLHVRIGGSGAFTYDKEFKLIKLIEKCVDSKNVQKQQKVKDFAKKE